MYRPCHSPACKRTSFARGIVAARLPSIRSSLAVRRQPLLDAVETATTLLSQRRQPDVWPVIILFSDGDDTISKASFKDVQERILATGRRFMLSTFAIPDDREPKTQLCKALPLIPVAVVYGLAKAQTKFSVRSSMICIPPGW